MALQSQEAPSIPSRGSPDIFRVKLQNTKDTEKSLTAKAKDGLFTKEEFLEPAQETKTASMC